VLVGVDRSEELMARARERGVYQRLLREDMRATSLPEGEAGMAISVLCVCHLPALEPFYREAARLLRVGGALVVIDFHWHFLLNGIPTHFDEAEGKPVAIENSIHLFSDHVRAAVGAGFALREAEERVVDAEWVARVPKMRGYAWRPVSFALVWGR
jgi:SAM-dependent methyltransferase